MVPVGDASTSPAALPLVTVGVIEAPSATGRRRCALRPSPWSGARGGYLTRFAHFKAHSLNGSRIMKSSSPVFVS